MAQGARSKRMPDIQPHGRPQGAVSRYGEFAKKMRLPPRKCSYAPDVSRSAAFIVSIDRRYAASQAAVTGKRFGAPLVPEDIANASGALLPNTAPADRPCAYTRSLASRIES